MIIIEFLLHYPVLDVTLVNSLSHNNESKGTEMYVLGIQIVIIHFGIERYEIQIIS